MAGTAFQELLNAVASYYGSGSDQWVEIARYGLNADNCAEILSQLPNVSTTVSNSGKIMSYTVDNVASVATQGAASAINSNTQTALMTQTASVNIPANMVVDSTGEIVAESGFKSVSAGSTVAGTVGKVAVTVGAVMAGLQFGAKIDELLYNINPDFWDSNGMSSVNPETWNDIICDTELGQEVFNVIFGIDENANSIQAYMQQEALAQIAQYLAVQGAFSQTSKIIPPEEVTEVVPNIPDMPLYYSFTYNEPVSGWVNHVDLTIPAVIFRFSDDPSNRWRYGIASDTPNIIAGTRTYGPTGTEYTTNITIPEVAYTINGLTCYAVMSSFEYDLVGITPTNLPLTNTTQNTAAIYNTIVYGTIEQEGGVEGIGKQDGSGIVIPTGITAGMTTAEILAILQSLYPDMFDKAIYNDVVQPDGTVIRYTYLPVPVPDNIAVNDSTGAVEPTGGTDSKQDADPISDTSPQDLIDTITDMMITPDPYDPTPPEPTNPTTYPDTGTGDTPAIVTPTGSASALYSIYNPTQAQLNSFGAWLWSNDFVEQLKKIFNDPMQSIIGLHKIFATPVTSGSGNIKVGYLNSGVSSALVSNQYTEIDCGSVNLFEYFGNVLDYLNTDVYCYLPFVGIVPLNVNDIMRSELNIKYKIDVLTGACLCSINVKRDLSGGQLYTYSGNCAVQYPLSSGSYMGILSSALSIAGSIAGTIASGGALLPVALGVSAGALSSAKTKVEMSGNITGSAGAMGIKKPYLIIRRPQTKIADNFEVFHGVSNNETATLSRYTGYTRIKYVHLENIPATDNELSEIETLLKNGIII